MQTDESLSILQTTETSIENRHTEQAGHLKMTQSSTHDVCENGNEYVATCLFYFKSFTCFVYCY